MLGEVSKFDVLMNVWAYYLKNIVSLRSISKNGFMVFTDIKEHAEDMILDECDNDTIAKYNVVNVELNVAVTQHDKSFQELVNAGIEIVKKYQVKK